MLKSDKDDVKPQRFLSIEITRFCDSFFLKTAHFLNHPFSMTAGRYFVSTVLRHSSATLYRHKFYRCPPSRTALTSNRFFSSLHASSNEREDLGTRPSPSSAESKPSKEEEAMIDEAEGSETPGAIGGFMRGLVGGQSVAVEDAFIAEAKEQGVKLPPPPPPRQANLVPLKRRKRREEEGESEQTIRDRIFGRFAGSAFMQGAFNAKEKIAERIDESDNPVVNMFRNIYDRFFAENEMAMVVREIREEDPSFKISDFLHAVETRLIPDILGAYLAGDRDSLKVKCTEGAYAMLNASIRERDTEGIVMDKNILDVSDVELTAGKVLEDSPVLIVSFNTQQINCLRDRAGSVVEGSEDDIRAVYYAWAFVKEVEFEDFVPSGGGTGADHSSKEEDDDEKNEKSNDSPDDTDKREWKLMEMVIRGAHSTI